MNNIFTVLFSSAVITIALQSIWIAMRARYYQDLTVGVLIMLLTFLFLLPLENSVSGLGLTGSGFIEIKSMLLLPLFSLTQWYVFRNDGDVKKLLMITTLIMGISILTSWYVIYEWPQFVWFCSTILVYAGIPVAAIRIMSPAFAEERSGKWFIVLMCAYQAAFLFWNSLHWPDDSTTTAEMVSPSLLFRIQQMFFVLSTGCVLIFSLYKHNALHMILRQHETKWMSFVQRSPFMVIELDKDGVIHNINDYGARLLGYSSSAEILRQNFFDTFILPSEASAQKRIHNDIMNQQTPETFAGTLLDCAGKNVIIRWVNFFVSPPHQSGTVTMLGIDITAEEHTNRLVAQLQKENEKEKIILEDTAGFDAEEHVIGKSQSFAYAIQRANQVATTHAPVLLEGETGVGKEVFANFIHRNSSRNNMPFIKVNCAALPKELIEDELFGHEKGAFTSAIQARKGRFELADGGTIFLDEIGELPLEMQPKLLRALQSGEFERIGGQKTLKVDVRILAATNRDLAVEITNGNFRSDLYYRLNVFPITIPPLRSRKEDLPDLIRFFISTECKKYNKHVEDISKGDIQRLLDYPWPGNIRELKNVIERAVIVSEGNTLTVDWWLRNEGVTQSGNDQRLEKFEKEHILSVLEKCNWKINGEQGAAQLLGMNPNTLRSKMKRLGIARPAARTPVLVS